MAGSLKLDGNEFLVKEGGQFKITNSELKLKSSGNTVVDSSGNALISESMVLLPCLTRWFLQILLCSGIK